MENEFLDISQEHVNRIRQMKQNLASAEYEGLSSTQLEKLINKKESFEQFVWFSWLNHMREEKKEFELNMKKIPSITLTPDYFSFIYKVDSLLKRIMEDFYTNVKRQKKK